jgi:hypothetical protein
MKIKSISSKTKHPQNNNLAQLYLDAKNPEAFAEVALGEIRLRILKSRRLPHQRIDNAETLANCLLYEYMDGNQDLLHAREEKNRSEITQQIERTINAVVKFACARTREKERKDRKNKPCISMRSLRSFAAKKSVNADGWGRGHRGSDWRGYA